MIERQPLQVITTERRSPNRGEPKPAPPRRFEDLERIALGSCDRVDDAADRLMRLLRESA